MPLKTKTSWKSKLKVRRNKPKVGTNPLRQDPTRTTTLRRAFVTELYKRFARLKGKIVKLIASQDALGLEKLVGTRNVSTVAELDNPTTLSILDSPYTLSWEERQGIGPLVGNSNPNHDEKGRFASSPFGQLHGKLHNELEQLRTEYDALLTSDRGFKGVTGDQYKALQAKVTALGAQRYKAKDRAEAAKEAWKDLKALGYDKDTIQDVTEAHIEGIKRGIAATLGRHDPQHDDVTSLANDVLDHYDYDPSNRVHNSESLVIHGGPGSGNFGHNGRPGEIGGSGEGGDRSILPPNPKTPTDVKVEIPFHLPPRTIAITKEVVKRFLGGNLQKAAGLVGAQPGANIRLSSWESGHLMIEVDHPKYHASRTLEVDDDGNKIMSNDSFGLMSGVPKGTGIGLKVFSDQVEHLRAEGFKYIKLDAARGTTMNGHYSWARMGCDAKIEDISQSSGRERVQKQFPNATRISDLMTTKADRDWWKANGVSAPMKFDLTEGSRSLRILYAYQDEMRKERGGKLTKNVDEPIHNEPEHTGEEIELTPEDEDALDRAWEKVIEEEKRRKEKDTTDNFDPNQPRDEFGKWMSGMVSRDSLNLGESAREYRKKFGEFAKPGKIKTLDISSIVPTHSAITSDAVDSYRKAYQAGDRPVVSVTKRDGKYYLTDGHHRVTAAIEEGATKVKVRVKDLDNPVHNELVTHGGPGSGNFGHSGRPGEVGGSGSGGGKGAEEISHLVEKIQHPVGKLLYKALSTAEKPVSYPAQLVGLGYKKLSPETRKEFRGAVRQIISSMPKTMLDQMVLKGVVLHENQESISRMSWWRSTGVVGFYKPLTGMLHSDGKESDDDWSRVGTLAHELMHAVDATGKFNMSWGKWNDKEAVKQIGWGTKHSSTQEWKQAMDKEIMPRNPNGLNRLSAYATTDHREAFAEFGRLVHGSDVSHAKIARLFPECTKYFKSNGLWTDRERKASPPSLKEREKAILWGSDKKKYEGLAGKEKKAFLTKLEKQYKELARDTIAGNIEDSGQLLPELFNHKEEGPEGSHADCWTSSFSQGTPTGNTRWADLSPAERVEAFQDWLQEQFDEEGITGLSGEELWERFTTEGFKRGQGRAFDDLSKSQLAGAIGDRDKTMFYQGNREQFLRSSFGQPVATEKVKLLAGRSFDELEGLTSEMGLKMSRVLTDGLVTGANPRDIAKGLVDQVDLSRTKAELIAQTEIIRAHNEGQLIALQQLGVEEVGVMVEWLTAGFGVCPECEMMEGVVLTLEEAKGLLPKHPRCRCCWLPANVGESKKDQIRGKEDIEDTMDEAYDEDEETPDIDEERPESIFDQEDEDEEDDDLADNQGLVTHGGPGSGDFGHSGRPGEVGGSAPGAGGIDPTKPPPSPLGGIKQVSETPKKLPYGLKELPKAEPLPKKEAAKFALASPKEIGQVKHIVAKKIKDAPVPSKKELKKMTEALEKAKMYTRKAKAIKDTVGVGKTKAEVTALTKQMIGPRPRTAGESRGNSKDRSNRARNLFTEFGGDYRGYVVCHISGIKMHWTDDPKENPHGYPKFEQSKIFVTKQGGGSQLSNLIPEARAANRSRNASKVRKENQE